MFGETAQSILTFNGAPNQRGYNTIEMIDFVNETQSFEFRQIEFSPGRRPHFSEANPQQCVNCHRGQPGNLRYNWDPYETWNGAFGENDDLVTGDEAKQLKSFLEKRGNSDRYKHLIIEPYSDTAPYTAQLNKTGHIKERPNSRMTVLMTRWNAKNVVRLMKKNPDYRLYRDLILVTNDAGKYNDKINREILSMPGLETIIAPDQMKELHRFRVGETGIHMLHAVIDQFGYSPRDWSLSFTTPDQPIHPGEWVDFKNFNNGFESLTQLVKNELWGEWFRENPDYQHLRIIEPMFSAEEREKYVKDFPAFSVFEAFDGKVSGVTRDNSLIRQQLLGEIEKLLAARNQANSTKVLLCILNHLSKTVE